METRSTTLLVIGGGPGGYVAAIRAAQLGIATTLVESDKLGGTCLNIGCIPSKALIHAAEQFEKGPPLRAGLARSASSVESPRIDLAQTVRWKDGIVARLSNGVAALLKKNGAQFISGRARIVDGKTAEVTTGAGQEPLRIVCEHLLLAPGSLPVELPAMPFGGARHLVDRSACAAGAAAAPGRGRRRLHRAGARHGVSQAGLRGDGGRGTGARAAGLRRGARQTGRRLAAAAGRAAASGLQRAGIERKRRRGAHPQRARPKSPCCRPIRCWSQSGGGRAPRAWGWRA